MSFKTRFLWTLAGATSANNVRGPLSAHLMNEQTPGAGETNARASYLRSADEMLVDSMTSVSMPPPERQRNDGMREMVLGMTHSPRPHTGSKVSAVVKACAKDFDSCPAGFTATSTSGETTRGSSCIATAAYRGPCRGGPYAFGKMDLAAKMRFEQQCQAKFPCTFAARDYSQPCPLGFESTPDNQCRPTAAYEGPCTRGPFSFRGYNAKMKVNFENRCEAFWPLAGHAAR
ncbi:unnamed protein product [Amoebophrya sp. A25]|nr:unnamed protein product [Amoebophrya sp. A25]|eukprot:GSA25T00020352001.1